MTNQAQIDQIVTGAELQAGEAEALAEVRKLTAGVRDRAIASAVDSERLRSLSPDAAAVLRELQPARLHAPASIGGMELSFTNSMHFIAELGSFDASLAWCAAVMSSAGSWLASYFSDEVVDEAFGDGRWPLVAISGIRGGARRVPGGYMVSGRSMFTSGVRQSDYVITDTTVDGDASRPISLVVPTTALQLIDNWDVYGLKGSGSSGFELTDVFVPDAWTLDVANHEFRLRRRRGGAAFTLEAGTRVTATHTGIMLGVTSRILSDITVALAERMESVGFGVGTQAGLDQIPGAPKREFVLSELSTLSIRLEGMRASAPRVFDRLLQEAASEEGVSKLLERECFAYVAEATRLAQDAASFAIRYAGSSTLYSPNPIERFFRDAYALGNHGMHNDGYWGLHGSALVNAELPQR